MRCQNKKCNSDSVEGSKTCYGCESRHIAERCVIAGCTYSLDKNSKYGDNSQNFCKHHKYKSKKYEGAFKTFVKSIF